MDDTINILHIKDECEKCSFGSCYCTLVLNNSKLMLNCRTNRQRWLGRPWL